MFTMRKKKQIVIKDLEHKESDLRHCAAGFGDEREGERLMKSGSLLPYRHNRGFVSAQMSATVHPV